MSKLDSKLIDFYQSKTLSPERLQTLLTESRSARAKKWWPLYTAAALLIIVVAGFFQHQQILNERKNIALREAAMNHKTKLQVDFTSTELNDLTKLMSKLDFSMRLPTVTNNNNIDLLGARYCTIAGNLAAHLRLIKRDSGEQISVFMTPIADELKPMINEHALVEGVSVRLWQEQGLFYAMADVASNHSEK